MPPLVDLAVTVVMWGPIVAAGLMYGHVLLSVVWVGTAFLYCSFRMLLPGVRSSIYIDAFLDCVAGIGSYVGMRFEIAER